MSYPPRFANLPPVNPESRWQIGGTENWRGAAGLAEDIRYYGRLVRDMAYEKIGHLYPKVQLPPAYGGGEASVIAWLWARTVKCPNPACGAQMPLVRSFWLSKKKGKETWVDPVVDKTISPPKVSFEVRAGKGKALDGTVNRRGAVCLCCDTPVAFDHVRAEGRAGRMQAQLMAVVAEGQHGRVYLSPTRLQVAIASKDKPKWRPEAALPHNPRDFKTPNYGINTFADLFTPRQLVALTTFSELINKIRDVIEQDALTAGLACDNVPLSKGGMGAKAYAEAVALYLSLAMDKGADYWSSICSWHSGRDTIRNTFARQAIPMNWDYAEGNPFSDSTGNWVACVNWVVEAVANAPAGDEGSAQQADATSFLGDTRHALFSTDPPYYDNIGYADNPVTR